MISVAQIESWVQGGESETLEFKRSTGERRAATQTLTALSCLFPAHSCLFKAGNGF